MFRVGILTCSDKGARGERHDTSAEEVRKLLPGEFQVEQYAVVPDEQGAITAWLVEWCDRQGLDLIITTGGTGLTPGMSRPRPLSPSWNARSPAWLRPCEPPA